MRILRFCKRFLLLKWAALFYTIKNRAASNFRQLAALDLECWLTTNRDARIAAVVTGEKR